MVHLEKLHDDDPPENDDDLDENPDDGHPETPPKK